MIYWLKYTYIDSDSDSDTFIRHSSTKLNMDWYIHSSFDTCFYPWLNFQVVGMEILIKARCRCHKDHHKEKKAFSVVIREAPIFPIDCMEKSEICLVRLARSISVVFDLISLRIERRPVLLLYTHVWMKVKHCHKCNFCRCHLIRNWMIIIVINNIVE